MKRITNFYLVLAFLLPFVLQAQPVVNLGPNATICGDSLVLNAGNAGATYLWNTGATTQTLTVYTSGTYWVDVTNAGTTRDSITLTIQPRPTITQHPSNAGSCLGPLTLNAAANFGIIRWFDNVGNVLGIGNTLNYNLLDTTTIWYESSQFSLNPTVVGRSFSDVNAISGTLNLDYGIRFNTFQPIVINSVRIQITGGPFTAVIQLENSLGQIIGTYSVSLPSAGYYDIPLNFSVPTGTNYTLYMRNLVGGLSTGYYNAGFNWSIYTYPFMALTGSTFAGLYPFFYEWRVSTLSSNCASVRDSVTINAFPTPLIALHSDTTICGGSLPLDATNPGSGFNYEWSTGETTATILADTTDTYFVTVSVGGNCAVQDSMHLVVNTQPAITQHPADVAVCEGLYTLTALNNAGTLRWLDTMENILGYGTTLTYNVQDTVTIWYEANQYEINPTVVGRSFSGATPTTGPLNGNYGLHFNVTQPLIINTVRIHVTTAPFTALIRLERQSQMIDTQYINYSTVGYYDVPLNFTVPIGNNYTLYMQNWVSGQASAYYNASFNWSIYTYPFLEMTGSTLAGLYPYFYDWNVSTLGTACSSPRDSVTITALPTPSVNLHNDTTLCGSSLVLNATNPGSGFNYLWSSGETTATILADTTDTYFVTVSVGGNCAVQDSMNLVVNTRPAITQHPPDTGVCKGLYTLAALNNAGTLRWLDTIGGNVLGYGNTLAYNVQDTVTIWYEANQFEVNPTVVGRSFSGANATSGPLNSSYGLQFNATQPIIINTVRIQVTTAPFIGDIQLQNSSGLITSQSVNFPTTGYYDVPLNFTVPIGTNYTLFMQLVSGQASGYFSTGFNWSVYTYPFMEMTGSTLNGLYPFFYEWNVSTLGNLCSSPLYSVTINALPTPIVALHNDTTLCGSSLVLDATNAGSGFNYLWSTGETTATIVADSTTNYQVTVSVGGNCPVVDNMNLTVNAKPIITQHPPDTSVCKGLQSITALANAGVIRWLDSTGYVLGYGNTLNYNVQNNLTLWYEASQFEENPTVVGRSFSDVNATSGTADVNCGMRFNAIQPIILNTVKIRTNGPFIGSIQLEDNQGQVIDSVSVNYPAVGDYDVPLGFNIPIGMNYTLYMRNITLGEAAARFPFTNWAAYTYPFIALTGTTVNSLYGYFYEWNVSTLGSLCSSDSASVVLNALTTPVVNLRSDTTLCSSSVLLDATNAGAGFNYLWSTGETTATILADSTATYQVTVSVGGNCPITDSMNLLVNIQPTITQHPNDVSVCKGLQTLVASTNSGIIRWFNSLGIIVGYGDTLHYNVQDTVTLSYESSQFEENPTVVGRSFSGTNATTGTADVNCGMRFNAFQPIIINTVKIQIDNGPFTARIYLENSLGQKIDSHIVSYPTAGFYNVPLYFNVPIGNNYTLYMRNISGGEVSAFYPLTNWSVYTYPFIALTGTTFTDLYGYFYEWNVSTLGNICSSARDSVVLNALVTPSINLAADSIFCQDTVILDVAYPNATYQWDDNSTNSSILVAQEGVYSVTSTIGTCSVMDSIEVFLNPIPTISVLSSDTTTCAGLIPRTSTGADVMSWYTDQTGGTLIGEGHTFMYNAQTTDTIWVQGQNFSNKLYPQALQDTFVAAQSNFYFPDNIIRGLVFNANENIRIKDVTMYIAATPFFGTIQLWDANDNILDSVNFVLTSVGENSIPLNFVVSPGANYRLLLTSYNDVIPILSEYPYTGFPIVGNYLTVSGGFPFPSIYQYFYKWNVQALSCPSDRLQSNITVLPTPNVDFPIDTIICGDTLVLDATSLNAQTYLWSTGVTTASVIIDTSTSVSLTATIGICSDMDSTNVFVVEPPDLILPPGDTIVCEGNLTLHVSGNAPYYAWYDSLQSTTPFAFGDSILYYAEDTTELWVEGIGFIPKSSTYGAIYNPTSNANVWIQPQLSFYPARGLGFNIHSPIILNKVSVFADSNTTVNLTIYKSSFPYYTRQLSLSIGENIIQMDTILEQGNYFIELSNNTKGKLLIINPYSNFNQLNRPEITFTGSSPIASQYNYFFNWKISTPSCATDRLQVRIIVPPSPPITMAADTATCVLNSIILDPIAINSPAYTYLWTGGSTADTLLATTQGYYSVTVTNDGKCSSTKDIFVQFLSTPITQNNSDIAICAPQTVNLGTNPSDGILVWYDTSGAVSYLTAPHSVYIPDTTNFYTNVAPRAVTRIGKQNYPNPTESSAYLNFIIANTFDVHEYAVLDSVAIYVETAPTTVSIELMDSFNQVLYTRTHTISNAHQKSFVPLDFVIPPGAKYQLNFANINTPFLVDQTPIATPTSSAAIATLTGTTFNGVSYYPFFDWHFSYAYPTCHSGHDTFAVTINIPIDLQDSIRVCDTAFIDIQHPSVLSYNWSDGQTTGFAIFPNEGTYYVTMTDGAACTIIDTINIDQPNPIGFPSSGMAICGDSILTTPYTDAEASFIWSTGDTTASITIPTTFVYSVTVTTNEGCVLTDVAYVAQIIPPSAYTPDLQTYTRFCFSGVLDAGFGGQGMSYLWSTGAITQQITVSTPGLYCVTVTHPLGCSGADCTYVAIDTMPHAAFTVYESGLSVGVNNTSTSGGLQATNYLWNMGDGTTYQIPNPLHTYDSSGCYRITLIVTTLCGSDTASVDIGIGSTPDSCTIGITQIPSTAMNLDFQIAPNPNNGQFRLSINKILSEDSKLVIVDINGRIIHQEELRANSQTEWQIQTKNLPSGVYFARLINSKESKTQRFTVITP